MYLIKNSLWQFFGHCWHQSTIFWLIFNNFIKNVKKCRYLLSDFNQLLQKEKVEKPQDGNQFSPFIYNLSFVVAIRDFTKGFFSVRKMPDPMIQLLPVKCHDPILSNFSGWVQIIFTLSKIKDLCFMKWPIVEHFKFCHIFRIWKST